MSVDEHDLRGRLAGLSLDEKCALLTGRDFWTLSPLPRIGLRPLVLSDGPNGVRGPRWDERDPSLLLPVGSAIAATWDVGLAHRVGTIFGEEARRRGVHVVLAPTVNIQRTPYAGRNFENFSEDPVLVGEMGAALVDGIQSRGVAATPKHLVCNDVETERMSYDVRVTPEVLAEVYLRPFWTIVRRSAPWALMAAYNSVNGTAMTEHRPLLVDLLKRRWGFDGVVVSDWTAARTTVGTALGGLDLVMPSHRSPWARGRLAAAVRSGQVPEAEVDDKVLRLLRLAARTGALTAPSPTTHGGPDTTAEGSADHTAGQVPERTAERPVARAANPGVEGAAEHTAEGPAEGTVGRTAEGVAGRGLGRAAEQMAARAAGQGAAGLAGSVLPSDEHNAEIRVMTARTFVLLRNTGALPLHAGSLRRVALIGENAVLPTLQGGGSSHVFPPYTRSPLQGLRDALPDVEITLSRGVRYRQAVDPLPLGQVTDPIEGGAGVRVDYLDAAGELVLSQARSTTALSWLALPPGTAMIRVSAQVDVGGPGDVLFSLRGSGVFTLSVAGRSVFAEEVQALDQSDPLGDLTAPPETVIPVALTGAEVSTGGRAAVEVTRRVRDGDLLVALELGFAAEPWDAGAERAAAARAARDADVTVVIVGTDSSIETEGRDRDSLRLPGDQDSLVLDMLAANPRTIVVVNAAAPVRLPWADRAPAVLWTWFGSQEYGTALADVLLGRVEPTGRLPWTLPADTLIAPGHRPVSGVLSYTSALVGYRGYLAADVTPRYAFGHGLGYTTWAYRAASAEPTGDGGVTVTVDLANTGDRPGTEVVQVYLDADPIRLVGFAPVTAVPGPTRCQVPVDGTALAAWDPATGRLLRPRGGLRLLIGPNALNLPLSTPAPPI